MCGRYRRTSSEEELCRIYNIPIPPQSDLPISWNIAPSQDVLAIRYNPKTKQRSLDALRWGLIPYWAKDPKIACKTINARAETVDTAPSCEWDHNLAVTATLCFQDATAKLCFPHSQCSDPQPPKPHN
jgi:putative SOS response-associated peptidase YedK